LLLVAALLITLVLSGSVVAQNNNSSSSMIDVSEINNSVAAQNDDSAKIYDSALKSRALMTNSIAEAQEKLRLKMLLPVKRESAAERYKAVQTEARSRETNVSEVKPQVALLDPGGQPHYFGPYPNYANSPMPRGSILSITVTNGGSGYSGTPQITIMDVYGTGSGAAATGTVADGVITGIAVDPQGSEYIAPIVIIEDATGTGATATATLVTLLAASESSWINCRICP
jgi:hypothetical protein